MAVATVLRKEQLTPQMVRIVVGSDGLGELSVGEFSDNYVKLQIPPPGSPIAPPFDADALRSSLPREQLPRTRTYTVRDWDPETLELTIDFVVHGDTGVAGPWAIAARPGDLLQVRDRSGGGYTPDPEAAWHLLAGDAAVIPAISTSLARVPAGVPAYVYLAVDGPGEEQPLETEADLSLTWLHTGGSVERAEEMLTEALRALEFPAGAVHAFIHGEADAVRSMRRHLLVERGVPKESMSASGYWKRSRTDEQWREDKGEWKRLAAEDELAIGR